MDRLDGIRFVLAYEAGRHRWPSEHYPATFRHVLRAATDAELGFIPKRRRRNALQHVSERRAADASSRTQPADFDGSGLRTTNGDVDRCGVLAARASPAISALVNALLRPFISDAPEPSRRPAAIEALTAAMSRARTAYQHSRYGAAAAALPGLMTDIQRVRGVLSAHQAAALEAEACQVASGLLLKYGEPALAALAAERCRTASERSEDELATACGARAFAHWLTAVGHASEGAQLAVDGSDRLAAASVCASRRPKTVLQEGVG